MNHDELIDRAISIFTLLDIEQAYLRLVEQGVQPEQAFLAVHAADILVRDAVQAGNLREVALAATFEKPEE